jgi:hypothetical protein
MEAVELMTVGAFWIFEFGFDPKMGQAVGAIMGTCQGIGSARR